MDPINTINIALFYDEAEKKDAQCTFEDLQAELEAWKYETSKTRKNKLTCNSVHFSFHHIKDSHKIFKKGEFFKKIYISTHLKNEFEFQCSTISEKVIYHPYPFQSLIEMVYDAKNK